MISGGRLWTITQDTEKCSIVILDPESGAENVSDIVQCFELFFDKEIIQQTVTETNRYAEYKNT